MKIRFFNDATGQYERRDWGKYWRDWRLGSELIDFAALGCWFWAWFKIGLEIFK